MLIPNTTHMPPVMSSSRFRNCMNKWQLKTVLLKKQKKKSEKNKVKEVSRSAVNMLV